MLPLSQSHLTILDACPRRYQHVFFDARSAPSTYEQHVKTQWGSQFHLLMQQQALNLPIQAVSSADTDMAASLEALSKAAPEVFEHLAVRSLTSQSARLSNSSRSDSFSQSEHRRMLAFNDYLLTVVYDLVVMPAPQGKKSTEGITKGHIFDWKTHQTPPPEARLRADWQTRLYLYVLCETTELAPEQISMTYWFVRLRAADSSFGDFSVALDKSVAIPANSTVAEPSSYQFGYSLAEHDRTRRDLIALTDSLTKMRRTENFPKVDIEKGICSYCPFAVKCDRLPTNASTLQSRSQATRSASPPTAQQLLKAASQLTADSVAEIPL
jgi:hypothetical protein